MITDVARALANLLVEGSSTISLSQVAFAHPGLSQKNRPALGLYLYGLQCHGKHFADSADYPGQPDGTAPDGASWIELYFLVIPWDWTHLGVQHLLSEMLYTLLQRGLIHEDQLPPQYRGFGHLPVAVSNTPVTELTRLWQSLGVPLQPSLNVTVSIPLRLNERLGLANLQVATR
jgi:hypothetical protein